jgi:hypothetical protein
MKPNHEFELLWPNSNQGARLPLTVWVLHLCRRAAVGRTMFDGARVALGLLEEKCI